MAKVTAIIDIGSNSCRMIIFQKTSRFGFFIVKEMKSRIRISEKSYENNGYLQPKAIKRALGALKSFMNCARSYGARKIIAVATSAVRDAPNRNQFLSLVKKELNLQIKIIDGTKEAYYGAIATLNLLPINDAITIDIGGGSTELALIKSGKIEKTISLDLGTVRLKELFSDKESNKLEIKNYILDKLKDIPEELKSDNIIGIGGTIRSISKVILQKKKHPINTIHGFEYSLYDAKKIIKKIKNKDPKKLGFKKDRIDVLQEGTFIFQELLNKFQSDNIITSGVGVREGVYLNDILRTVNRKFPTNFNPSVRSLIDRFCLNDRLAKDITFTSGVIFDILSPIHTIDKFYKKHLLIASRIVHIGVSLDYYTRFENSFSFILASLNYGFRHSEQLLIAHIVKFNKKSLPKKGSLSKYDNILPSLNTIQWLSFILKLSDTLNSDFNREKYKFRLENKILYISSRDEPYLAKERVKELELPDNLEIKFI